MYRIHIFLSANFLLLLSFAFAQGQGVAMGNGVVTLSGFGDVDLEKSVELWAENYRSQSTLKMDLIISRMQTICEVEENDSKKLRLTVKGIVGKQIATGRKQAAAFLMKSGVVPSDENLEEQEYEEDEKLTFYAASPGAESTIVIGAFFEVPITEHPLWIRAFNNTLNEIEIKRYQEFQVKQNTILIHAAIDLAIGELNAKIYLTDEQVNQLRQHLRVENADLATTSSPSTINYATRIARALANQPELIDEFLTPKQLELRKALAPPIGVARVSWGRGPDG
jgi:hypothetical protein